MSGYKVVSSDSHVVEPPDVWIERMPSKFKDKAPRVVREETGDFWYIDEDQVFSASLGGAEAGSRFEGIQTFDHTFLDDVRPGGYIPEEQIKDMDSENIYAGILYPTFGLCLYRWLQPSDLMTVIFRAYNDWLVDFCSPFPARLKGIAMINIDDIDAGILEMQRCANLGLSGVMIPVYPRPDKPYRLPDYEPFWAAAQDLEMPVSLHFTTNRPSSYTEFSHIQVASLSDLTNIDHWVRMSLADMIFSGVFERYPRLQVGAVEHELSWVAHFMDRLDYNYTQRIHLPDTYRYKESMLPSDYFRRNIFLSFQEDALGIQQRDIIGIDALLWASDYPHPEGTFPRSREILEEILADCTEEEKAKIAGTNSIRVYQLD